MKPILLALIALCVGSYTLQQESQLQHMEHNKYQLYISDPS